MTRAASMADRRHALLRADREAQLEGMRERLGDLGAERDLRQLDAARADWLASPWARDDGDAVAGYVDLVAGQVKVAMADLGASAERLDSVRVVATLNESVSAQLTPFADGSGLVNVADATISLCAHYARFLAVSLAGFASGSRARTLWRVARATARGGLAGDPDALTALLRYYATNQRIFALAGKLDLRLAPEAEPIAGLLAHLAAQFVVGHEIAHHVLGHRSAPSALSPDEYLPACSEGQRRELAADLLAHRAVRRAGEREFAGVPGIARALDLGSLGPLIAMLAVHLTERALFVRRGCTHPPARVRTALMLDQLNPQMRQFGTTFLDAPLAATEAAATTSEAARPFSPGMFGSAPVHTPLPGSYLRTITVLDALQCRPASLHLSMLVQEARETGAAWMGEGARLVMAGEPAVALRRWGVPGPEVERICDRRRALTFFALLESVRRAFAARGLPDAHVLACALAAAMLTAARLGIEPGR